MWLFHVRVVVAGSRRLHREQRTMYLPNHR